MTNLESKMIETRRKFHTMAEPAWLEFNTTIRIIEYMKELGYDIEYGKKIHSSRMGLPTKEQLENHAKTVQEKDFDITEILEGYTGLVASLDTGKEGPTIGMRFDIDANDVAESKDEDHRPFKEGFISKNPVAMHACGHDGHITIGLFVASWIAENKDNLKGKFKIFFQPAEEGVRGAKSMVEAGVLEGVDFFMGGHIGLGVPSGVIGLGTTAFLATTKLDVTFKGKSAHAGAKPEEGKNALLGAATCALNLHTLPQISGGMSRLNVGRLEAGSGRNVVPSDAKLQIETRGETTEIIDLLNIRTKEVIKGAASMYDLEYHIEEVGGAPAYNNVDEELVNNFKNLIESKDKDYKIELNPILGASEDVAYMMNFVEENGGKAIHMIYGSDLSAGHHNDRFDFDEKVLIRAYDIIVELIKYFEEL